LADLNYLFTFRHIFSAMGRLVRILLYAFIILILYFWITAIVRSYQKREVSLQVPDTTQIDTNLQVTNVDTTFEDGAPPTNEEIVDGTLDYKELDDKVKEIEQKQELTKTQQEQLKKQPDKSVKTQKSGANVVVGDGGKFKVIAGSYLLKENADKMVKKLKSLGYKDAKIVVFSASGYHSVVAASYSSESMARSAVSTLKSKDVDSFVKTQ
jgi:cell division protein FtsN